jgi:hypothetical protein
VGVVEQVANLDSEKNKTNVVLHAKLVRWCKPWVVLTMATSAKHEFSSGSSPAENTVTNFCPLSPQQHTSA